MKTLGRIAAAMLFLLTARELRGECNVSATSVNFGRYDVFVPTPHDSTGTVTVECDDVPPPDVVVSIGPSGNTGGFHPRKMRLSSGAGTLDYNLFSDPSMTVVWGDGTAGTSTVFLKNVKRQKPPEVVTIYGRIPSKQDVPAGVYSDTLTVTITW